MAVNPVNSQAQTYEVCDPNPLAGVNMGLAPAPEFVDLDGDGDLDLVAGGYDGTVFYYENNGGAYMPAATNPFAGIDQGYISIVELADLDDDGDLDLVIGGSVGTLLYYENTGGVYAPAGVNPFAGINIGGGNSAPELGDLDGDGDLDLVLGANNGEIFYYENSGGAYALAVPNPFAGIDVGNFSTPELADLDGDGDLDLFIGANDGTIHYYENNGGVYAAAAPNPFAAIDVGNFSTPTFVDIDGDGDLDLVSGSYYGPFFVYCNTPLVCNASNGTFSIN